MAKTNSTVAVSVVGVAAVAAGVAYFVSPTFASAVNSGANSAMGGLSKAGSAIAGLFSKGAKAAAPVVEAAADVGTSV